MKYNILSSLEYGTGKILLFCSRFDNVFTGNNEQSPEFCRSCFEWVSGKTSLDIISVLTVVNDGEDGGYRVFDIADKVNITRGQIADLADSNFISKFDVICIFGVDNNISPLIRLSIESYVSSGGGLILSDIHIDGDYIDLLQNISSVYCIDSGVNLQSGRTYWTTSGASELIYNKAFSNMNVQILNTISEFGLSSPWEEFFLYDTSTESSSEENVDDTIIGTVFHSSDYDIKGDRIVGYFSGVYKKGILTVSETE